MSARKTALNTMGTWKLNTEGFRKDGKRPSRSSSGGPSRIVVRFPPPNGWPGGDPKDNGFRAGGRK